MESSSNRFFIFKGSSISFPSLIIIPYFAPKLCSFTIVSHQIPCFINKFKYISIFFLVFSSLYKLEAFTLPKNKNS